jgi:hypothetical protein
MSARNARMASIVNAQTPGVSPTANGHGPVGGWTGPRRPRTLAAPDTGSEDASMARTPQEIFQHHAEALVAGDLDEIVADYTDDAVIITPQTVFRGKAGVRQGFTQLFADLPSAKWDVVTQVFEGDVLLLEWRAETSEVRVRDGIDTVVFSADGIRAQTLTYTVEPLLT